MNVDPDILIIDEGLGVGDEAFFQKCQDRIMDFRRAGKAMLCFSHSLEPLETLCDRAVWLDHGRPMKDGDVRSVLRACRGQGGLSKPLHNRHRGQVFVGDWGVVDSLRFLAHGKRRLRVASDLAARPPLRQEEPSRLRKWVAAPEQLFVGHTVDR